MSNMMRPLTSTFLAAALIAAPCGFAAPAAAQTEAATKILRVGANTREQRITLGLGKAEIVELDRDVKDVDVAGPDIVDAVVKSPRRVLLIASKAGQTNVFFTDGEGRRLLALDIRVERDTTDLEALMRVNLPNAAIKVQAIADNVLLSGVVSSATEAARAVNLANGFAGDPKKVVNMLSVSGGQQVMLKVRIAEMSRNIAKQFNINAAGALNVGGVPIIAATQNPYGLLGKALADASGVQVGSVCPQAFVPNRTGTTTSTLTTGNSTVNTITNGINNNSTTYNTAITSTNPNLQQPGIVTGQQNTNTASVVGSAVQTIASAIAPTVTQTITDTASCASANNAQGILNALEQVGLVHLLAEPNLTAVSGETARFLAGGEFPIPVARDRDGNITVDYKQFGVGLSFTPVVLSSGRISLQISTEVSELTSTGAYQIGAGANALTVPALAVRRAQTTVELPSGGTFAIAGLMQHNTRQSIAGLPGAKDIPVLGGLFRSRDFQNQETELVVLASIYLAEPNAAGAYTTPTEGFVPPTDPETILMGRLNATYNKTEAPVQSQAANPAGFIVQ